MFIEIISETERVLRVRERKSLFLSATPSQIKAVFLGCLMNRITDL
jgi:hypothetical protein